MEGLRQEERVNNIKSTIVSPGSVNTDLYKTISDKTAQEALFKLQGEIGMSPGDIAEAVVYVIETPPNVSVSNIIIRPTKQVV